MTDREHKIQDKSSEVVYSPAPSSCTGLGKVGVKLVRACREVTRVTKETPRPWPLPPLSLCSPLDPLPPGEASTPVHRATPPPQGILYQQGSLRSLSCLRALCHQVLPQVIISFPKMTNPASMSLCLPCTTEMLNSPDAFWMSTLAIYRLNPNVAKTTLDSLVLSVVVEFQTQLHSQNTLYFFLRHTQLFNNRTPLQVSKVTSLTLYKLQPLNPNQEEGYNILKLVHV